MDVTFVFLLVTNIENAASKWHKYLSMSVVMSWGEHFRLRVRKPMMLQKKIVALSKNSGSTTSCVAPNLSEIDEGSKFQRGV